jgi:hypothetical protein
MSCFAKIKSPLNGATVTSPAYYQLTSFFPPDQGKKMYQATTTNEFKNQFGFDWTKPQEGYNPKVNFAGEPTIEHINAHLGLGLNEREIRAAQQMEEVASLGYLDVGYNNPNAFDLITNEINLNSKYNLVESEVLVRDGKHYLSIKPVPNGKKLKPVSKDYLRLMKFPESVINSVQDFSNATLGEMMDGLINNKQLPEFQRKMIERLRNLMSVNPTLKLTVFDDAEVDQEYQRSFYDPKSNTIYIGKTVTSDFNTERFTQELIHEAVHAYTVSALTNPRTSEEINFRQGMEKYMNEYRNKFPRLQRHYGFKNVEEFVSEYLSNPYFREDLLQAESTSRDKSFIGRVVSDIKRFLSKALGLQDSMFDRVNETINNYFDYLENLEDMPDLAGEHELRFNAPYTTPVTPVTDSIDISRFKEYIDATFASSSWKQLSQSLTDIDPRFKSIERLREKFGNLSTLSLGNAINSSLDYLEAINQLLNRVDADVILHNDNLGYYSSEDAVVTFNHAMNVADFILEQVAAYENTLVPELSLKLTKDAFDKDPGKVGDFMRERQKKVENFNQVSKELLNKITAVKNKATALKNNAKQAILEPVAIQLSEPFRLVAEKLQDPNSDLNKEIAAKEKMLAQAVAANQPNQAKDIRADLDQLKMMRDWVPTTANILKLLQSGIDEKYKGASFFTVYLEVALGVANAVKSPIVQSVKQYLDVHLIEAEQKSLEYTRRTEKLREKIEQRNKKQGIGWDQNFGNFYKNFTREADMVYYDDNGVRRVIKQVVYNTQFKEAEFRNDLQELERNVETAEKNGVEAEITAAKLALEKFLEAYAVRPYTEEYYEAEELLSDDARTARKELLDQMEEQQAIFGDAELSEDEIETRGNLRREYERLGSIYNEDGSEKPKGSKERDIADSIIAYKNKRKSLEAVEFVIPEKLRIRFEIEKNSKKEKVNNLERKVSILTIDINDTAALGQPTDELENKLEAVKKELEIASADLENWLKKNTRTEIHPEFFELQRGIADEIRNIFIKYGQDPLLSEAYDEMFNSVKGYRDENGVIVGNKIQLGLSTTIRGIEERIELLKENAENSRNISEEDKQALKRLFKKLNDIQSKEQSLYYRQTYKAIANTVATELLTEKDTQKSIKELAEKYADEYIENSGAVIEELDLDDKLPALFHPSEFGQEKHRKELIKAYELLLTEKEVQKRMKQTDWYKANHIDIKRTYTDKRTGEQVTTVKQRPIYIWSITVPRNTGYILRENPNFDWSLPRVRDEYKNKDHNFLGRARPRQTADNKYTNPEYAKLTADEKEIVGEMVSIYEDIQRDLPVLQRLEGYTIQNKVKDKKEKVTDLYTRPLTRFRTWVDEWKLLFKPGIAGEEQDEDEISNLLDESKNKSLFKSGRKLQLIKTRYKEPLNSNQVSMNLLGSLAEYGTYGAQFAGLKKALPTVFAARDIAEEKNMPKEDIDMLNEEIQRFFYGEEVTKGDFGKDSKVLQATTRAMRRLFKFTQSRALAFNFMRLFKNVITNFLRIMLKKNTYGFTRRELLKAWWKGLSMRRSLLSLEQGSKQYSEYALKLMHFRAVPNADPTNRARNVHQTGIYKYLNLENLNSQVFAYTEMASTIPIYEAFMARTTVPIIINGQQTTVNLSDAYEVIDGMLVPKDGVFGLEQNAMRALIGQRKQIMETFLAQEGVATINQLNSSQKIALKNALTSTDVKINALESVNKAKREKLRLVEQYVRDQIHEMYTSTQGNYFGRSRSAYEKRLLLSMLMSMRRWLQPSIQNAYGDRRMSMYTGKIVEGFYKGGGRSLVRKMRYLTSGERVSLGYTEIEKENHRKVLWDNINAIALHGITLGLTSLVVAGLGGGGDEEESKLLAILAMISLGTYDEYISLHPILGPSNWTYKTFFRKPLDRPGDEQGVATLGVKYGLYMVAGSQMRSYDQLYDALFNWRNLTNPFEPYYVQRRDVGGNSPFYTPDPIEGLPRAAAVAMQFYGLELGLKPFAEPNKRVMNMLKLNPMLGMNDPLGDYVQTDKKIIELKREILRRNTSDNVKFLQGRWDEMSKVDIETMVEKTAELRQLQAMKNVLEMDNPFLQGAKLEKEMSAFEGQQDAKTLDFMMETFFGDVLPKMPPHPKKEMLKAQEKLFQELRKSRVKVGYEDYKTQNMNFD